MREHMMLAGMFIENIGVFWIVLIVAIAGVANLVRLSLNARRSRAKIDSILARSKSKLGVPSPSRKRASPPAPGADSEILAETAGAAVEDDADDDTGVSNHQLMELIHRLDRQNTRKGWFQSGIFFFLGLAAPYAMKVAGY
ncbi:MAG: hypothetical protein ACR2O4_16515 [Hyphomicrobiaceae bacterium]